jgi:hypothetical protein
MRPQVVSPDPALRKFELLPVELLDVLTTADMITGPEGAWVRAEERLKEIFSRYEHGSPVYRAVTGSGSELLASVERRLAEVGAPPAQPT